MKQTILLGCLVFFATITFAQNKIEIEFKTGEDDLRGIGTTEFSPDVNIKLVNKPDVVKRAINGNSTWPKNSIRKISIPLDATLVISDLEIIELVRKHSNSGNPTTKSPDNWDINDINITATFKENGQTVKYKIAIQNKSSLLPYRMTYENSETPKQFRLSVTPEIISGAKPTLGSPNKSTITAKLGVGGDDLRGSDDNAKIVILFNNSNLKLVFNNVNNGANWGNFSEHEISKTINSLPNLSVNDIKTVELWHTGGGGMGADNWDIDKFVLSITINGITKQLVDVTGTPVHRFTGDTRKKVFTIE